MHRARITGRSGAAGGPVVDATSVSSAAAADGRPVICWPEGDPAAQRATQMAPLKPGVVDVWGWVLDDSAASNLSGPLSTVPDAVFSRGSETLSADEMVRAGRLISARHRLRFISAHVGLRRVLSGYLGVEAGAIPFASGDHGKPHLEGGSTVRFNLSHSRNVALLAVCDGVDVGVDVEFMRPITEDIAGRFFSASENAALRAMPEEERLASFYACWTRKEAFLKGLGTGIGAGLDKFSVTLPGHGDPALSDDGSGMTASWSLAHLEPAAGYVGAVAAKNKQLDVRCFRLAL